MNEIPDNISLQTKRMSLQTKGMLGNKNSQHNIDIDKLKSNQLDPWDWYNYLHVP